MKSSSRVLFCYSDLCGALRPSQRHQYYRGVVEQNDPLLVSSQPTGSFYNAFPRRYIKRNVQYNSQPDSHRGQLHSSSLLIKNSYSSCSHYPLTVRLFQQIIEVQHQHLSVGFPTSLVVIILILHFIENISHSNFLNLGSLQFSSI